MQSKTSIFVYKYSSKTSSQAGFKQSQTESRMPGRDAKRCVLMTLKDETQEDLGS